MSSLNRPPFSGTTWTILGRNNLTADFKDAPWLAEASEITKDKVRIDQSVATLSEKTTPSHGDLARPSGRAFSARRSWCGNVLFPFTVHRK